ncbi:gamma-glutamyl-phosphate reductase [Erysipelothrix larvae]|uniref:Gamma-glutamyl phosphate reductase n=1 Tax=Erysipelothrix larvae TaxID=1514105 RepID=A0A120JTZ0_9FIRM|nr:glutamate-5-semialdehyde dehydrogenase [Erysipelothrix larvae]AMC94367.1 gamma-glutamyl-phosphate reductase [Erysipelothrix larvae]
MNELGYNAKKAAHDCQHLSTTQKNAILRDMGQALVDNTQTIINANRIDVYNAHDSKMSQPLIDRLTLNDTRIQAMKESCDQLIELDDPVGVTLNTTQLENGLNIEKISVPLGVIGIIYESRPNVTLDAFALCFKAGNAVVLKGGKEALNTNITLESIIRKVLISHNTNPHIIQLIKSTDRESTLQMMKMNDAIDVLIPRGSAGLIQAVIQNSTIPVIETGAGNCHIYIDESYDETLALQIIENAKLQRLGVCNAAESLVIHQKAHAILPKIIDQLRTVTFYGDLRSISIDPRIQPASQEDFYTEYLDTKLSVKVVDTLEEAIEHINTHNTKHSEAIITTNPSHAETFLNDIDAACVYVNASTRFTDGFEMGMGAEIGISTQKLHARGPMGLKELTSYKYKIRGEGQVR